MTDKCANISQKQLDVLAKTLGVKYQVEDNLTGGRSVFSASITLTNRCDVPLKYDSTTQNWKIFFCHLRMVEPNFLPIDDSVDLDSVGVKIAHLNGSIFSLSPLSHFKTLNRGDSVVIAFNGQHYSASRTDVLPNWYIQTDGLDPRVIVSTEGENLDFVGEFDTPKKYKRFDYVVSGKRRYDAYQPFTGEDRFTRYPDVQPEKQPSHCVIPTPVSFCEKSKKLVDVTSGRCQVYIQNDEFLNEAKYLSEKLDIPLSSERLTQSGELPVKSIVLQKDEVKSSLDNQSNQSLVSESYHLDVDSKRDTIVITANQAVGMFYGVQTLASLCAECSGKPAGRVPDCEVKDTPRYPYRGMHVDISRNFQSKAEILRLLDQMATYKLNKFHFHLTDDEGWRLEIPGLEELTQIGSVRGHDPEECHCLLPLLGSGPEPSGLGCGFYSVQDYRDILRYAKVRHIEVIPEIDMPGHSHAAVRAMRVRYDRLMARKEKKEARKYLLSDPSDDPCKAFSVQMLGDNSMNPGLDSTFTFVDKVITELKIMHADIQPLKVFHLGADEVPYEAWDQSLACLQLVKAGKVKTMDDLMEYFVTRVAEITHKHGLDLGAWQDGIVVKKSGPYQRSKFPNSRVIVHYWRNVWESAQAFDAFKLANSNYEVVLAPGTHLYFDHPYEPDPEERGLFWACRYIDCHKVFCFAPDNLMSNADVKLSGDMLTKADRQQMEESEVPLTKPHNVKGIQGQIWTELVRTSQQFHAMIFPRLLALAERAWHRADWESADADSRGRDMEADWIQFASCVGEKELQRLEMADIPYHIPPPGVRLSKDGKLEMRSCYPGQPLSYSLDEGSTWQVYTQPVQVGSQVTARVSSHDGKSHSRLVEVKIPSCGEK